MGDQQTIKFAPDYSFQSRCPKLLDEARAAGERRILFTAPTGSGKGNMIKDLVFNELDIGGRPIVYSNRKVIRDQLTDRLLQFGIQHGIRAAGFKADLQASAQVASLQTEGARSLSPNHPWRVHDATLAIFDEAHSQKAKTAKKVMKMHLEQGATIAGFTATPVGLSKLYDQLIPLAGITELRKRGVLVPCHVFAPPEISMAGLDIAPDGDFVLTQAAERVRINQKSIFGNALEWFDKINPEHRPSVLFAPGVPESRWFVQEFTKRGISSAHIDAETPDADRKEAFLAHKNGDLILLSSFGVLAEGWDAPWASHGILVRPCSAAHTYLQLVGRLLRAYPGKSRATLQDHVGAWWRPGLGSPNINREWDLCDNSKTISKKAKTKQQEGEPQAARCPKCGRPITRRGSEDYVCPCGNTFKKSVREVLMRDGSLKRQLGNATKTLPPRDDDYIFRSAIFSCARSGRTVRQAWGVGCRMKKKRTKDPEAKLIGRNIKIKIPPYGSSDWDLPAAWYYRWAAKKE